MSNSLDEIIGDTVDYSGVDVTNLNEEEKKDEIKDEKKENEDCKCEMECEKTECEKLECDVEEEEEENEDKKEVEVKNGKVFIDKLPAIPRTRRVIQLQPTLNARKRDMYDEKRYDEKDDFDGPSNCVTKIKNKISEHKKLFIIILTIIIVIALFVVFRIVIRRVIRGREKIDILKIGEAKQDTRQETRQEARQETRQEARQETRQDTTQEPRQETTQPERQRGGKNKPFERKRGPNGRFIKQDFL